MVGRQPEDVPEVLVRPAPLRRPQQVRRLRAETDQRPRRPFAGTTDKQPLRAAVRHDRGPLDDPPLAGRGAAVRRLEPALARRHLPAATLALVPATFFRRRLAGASVPTSVSLSSPRMKASTRLNAMSSWIWTGGLFMK